MRFLIIGGAKEILELFHVLKRSFPNKHEYVVLVDKQKDVEAITREVDITVFSGDLFDEDLYLEAGLKNVDIVVAMHENDMVNAFASMLAREYNVPKIIVVVSNKALAKMLRNRGITEWIIERSGGISEKIKGFVLGFDAIEFGNNILIIGKAMNIAKLPGKAIKELEDKGIKVLAVIRDNTLLELQENTIINDADVVMLFGSKENIFKFLH